MRVLLVQPAVSDAMGFRGIAQLEPLGLECVAASLLGEHTVEIFDGRFERDLSSRLRSFRPDAVGVSATFTAEVNNARQAIATVRSVDPTCRIFVGGHHASMAPDDLAGEVDALIVGEGETASRQLLSAWENDRRLTFTAGPPGAGEGSEAHSSPLIADLDATPLPARHLTRRWSGQYHFGNWRPAALVETSRGCPYHCRFCAVWKFYHGQVRTRGVERVLTELNQVEAPYVVFADDNLFADIERARNLAIVLAGSGNRRAYLIQVRTDTVVKHPDLVELWAKVGLKVAFVGYESFTQERLDHLNKHNSLEANEAAIKIFRRHQVQVLASIIVDPNFTRDDFAALADYVQRQRLVSPIFTVLTPLPGTDLYEEWHNELADNGFELFDLQHALLPTHLGLTEFYHQYGRLYLSAFLNPRSLIRLLRSGSPLNVVKALWQARQAINPANLAAAHDQHNLSVQ